MTREELSALMDACRDGEIDDRDAARLRDFLRQHPDDAQWVAGEVEWSGLIGQALDNTEPEDFVRGFHTRLDAEQSADRFSRDTVERATRPGSAANAPPSAGLAAPAREDAVALHTEAAPPRRRLNWLPGGLVMLLLVGVAAAILWQWRPWTRAVVREVSPGVRIERADHVMQAEADMPLEAGDRIDVPTGGHAALAYRRGAEIALGDRTAVLFEPGTVPVHGEQRPRRQRFFLESGHLAATVTKGGECIVFTPHAKAQLESGTMEVSVTPSSTRVATQAASVRLTHNRGGIVETLPPHTERVVTTE